MQGPYLQNKFFDIYITVTALNDKVVLHIYAIVPLNNICNCAITFSIVLTSNKAYYPKPLH